MGNEPEYEIQEEPTFEKPKKLEDKYMPQSPLLSRGS
jgi:hypothetical protein